MTMMVTIIIVLKLHFINAIIVSTNTRNEVILYLAGWLYKEITYYTFITITKKSQTKNKNREQECTVVCFSYKISCSHN